MLHFYIFNKTLFLSKINKQTNKLVVESTCYQPTLYEFEENNNNNVYRYTSVFESRLLSLKLSPRAKYFF